MREADRDRALRAPSRAGHGSRAVSLGRRVFWVLDNGSSHRGAACERRLRQRWRNVRGVHTPVHASWLNQIEIHFSIVQRKVLTPHQFVSRPAQVSPDRPEAVGAGGVRVPDASPRLRIDALHLAGAADRSVRAVQRLSPRVPRGYARHASWLHVTGRSGRQVHCCESGPWSSEGRPGLAASRLLRLRNRVRCQHTPRVLKQSACGCQAQRPVRISERRQEEPVTR